MASLCVTLNTAGRASLLGRANVSEVVLSGICYIFVAGRRERVCRTLV